MATSLSSGLAIAGAATIVAVALVTAYNVVFKDVESDAPVGFTAQNVLTVEPNATVDKQKLVVDDVVLPSFDVVRIDEVGAAVVAGKAAVNTTVSLRLDGAEIAKVQTDAAGSYVALFDVPSDTNPRELFLVAIDKAGIELTSKDQVLVMPVFTDKKAAPKIVVATSGGVDVVKDEPKNDGEFEDTIPQNNHETTLSLETIVYDDVGGVIVSGGGNSEDFIRLYIDNKPSNVEKIESDDQWKVTLSDVPEGLYTLRIDTVDAQGLVKGRVESPFKKEASETIVASSKDHTTNVTIQPGYTLWQLAKNRYGNGIRYVQIFEANRDIIKDPDLIYPGQIFDLPAQ